jgi:transcriptional regulator with XRE-family HTH domain/tetratricopeptide (TPR) repeat protein
MIGATYSTFIPGVGVAGDDFGALLRVYRRRAGLTQEELADKSGISVRAISKMETGRSGTPRAETVRLLAAVVALTDTERTDFIQLAATSDRQTGPARGGEAPTAGAWSPAGQPLVPAQLPADIRGFIGRIDALRYLDSLLDERGRTQAVMLATITGMAGVGKTTLAVHWSHRAVAAGEFPDGQLYVNLRGFDPHAEPVRPAAALRGFLDALHVPARAVPTTIDRQSALLRSLLVGRRMLLVLDNARDAEQVRPLLPGSPGCFVLVTSRDELSGLLVTDAAGPVRLGLLSVPEARQLLANRLGADPRCGLGVQPGAGRITAEPSAVDELIAQCAGLPLALAIMAARAATTPDTALSVIAAEQRDAATLLDALDTADTVSDLRRVFSTSYRTLSGPSARLFRLLALHPGPAISEAAAASLAGVPLEQTRELLHELTRAHLVAGGPDRRYTCHDLLRVYAAERAFSEETADGRAAALCRLLDHYVGTAFVATAFILPLLSRQSIAVRPPGADVVAQRITDLAQAVAWFSAERAALVALIRQAAAEGFDVHVCQLAWCVRPFLDLQRHLDDQTMVQRAALEAAQRLGHRQAQAEAARNLGRVLAESGHDADAARSYQHASGLYAELGDLQGQARVSMSMGMLAQRCGDPRGSLHHHRVALALFEHADDAAGRANALNNVALNMLELGDDEQALHHAHEALALVQKSGDIWSEAGVWDSLAGIHLHMGDPDQAIACARRALDLVTQLGDRYHQAMALLRLADACEAIADRKAATNARESAAAILDQLGHADADAVRARIDAGRAATDR